MGNFFILRTTNSKTTNVAYNIVHEFINKKAGAENANALASKPSKVGVLEASLISMLLLPPIGKFCDYNVNALNTESFIGIFLSSASDIPLYAQAFARVINPSRYAL